ncbi:SPFH domain-containing protein, partial [Patescibacteria group bacterium]
AKVAKKDSEDGVLNTEYSYMNLLEKRFFKCRDGKNQHYYVVLKMLYFVPGNFTLVTRWRIGSTRGRIGEKSEEQKFIEAYLKESDRLSPQDKAKLKKALADMKRENAPKRYQKKTEGFWFVFTPLHEILGFVDMRPVRVDPHEFAVVARGYNPKIDIQFIYRAVDGILFFLNTGGFDKAQEIANDRIEAAFNRWASTLTQDKLFDFFGFQSAEQDAGESPKELTEEEHKEEQERRKELAKDIRHSVNSEIRDYGIELVQLGILRARPPQAIQDAHERMDVADLERKTTDVRAQAIQEFVNTTNVDPNVAAGEIYRTEQISDATSAAREIAAQILRAAKPDSAKKATIRRVKVSRKGEAS